MKYLIIGLGIYGANLARDLTEMGHEVIGADDCQSNIESLKNYISTVYLIDSTEENQLAVLPLLNVDLVIVAIGENFGASIKTVALLKKAGVKHIYARAIDTLHEAILQSFEIDRIITPEQRAAEDLTHELELGSEVTTLKVDADNVVVNFAVQDYILGLTYADLSTKLANDYGLTLVAVSRPTETTNILGIKRLTLKPLTDKAAATATHGDIITIFGNRKKIIDFCKARLFHLKLNK